MGSNLQAACQPGLVNAFSSYAYIRHFEVGDLAGMAGWHQSRANLVVTSGQGTLKLWRSWD